MNASQREREVRSTNHVIEQPPSSLERGALTTSVPKIYWVLQ